MENGTKALHNPDCSLSVIKGNLKNSRKKTHYLQVNKRKGDRRFIVKNLQVGTTGSIASPGAGAGQSSRECGCKCPHTRRLNKPFSRRSMAEKPHHQEQHCTKWQGVCSGKESLNLHKGTKSSGNRSYISD